MRYARTVVARVRIVLVSFAVVAAACGSPDESSSAALESADCLGDATQLEALRAAIDNYESGFPDGVITFYDGVKFDVTGRSAAHLAVEGLNRYRTLDPQTMPQNVADFGSGLGRFVLDLLEAGKTAYGFDLFTVPPIAASPYAAQFPLVDLTEDIPDRKQLSPSLEASVPPDLVGQFDLVFSNLSLVTYYARECAKALNNLEVTQEPDLTRHYGELAAGHRRRLVVALRNALGLLRRGGKLRVGGLIGRPRQIAMAEAEALGFREVASEGGTVRQAVEELRELPVKGIAGDSPTAHEQAVWAFIKKYKRIAWRFDDFMLKKDNLPPPSQMPPAQRRALSVDALLSTFYDRLDWTFVTLEKP